MGGSVQQFAWRARHLITLFLMTISAWGNVQEGGTG